MLNLFRRQPPPPAQREARPHLDKSEQTDVLRALDAGMSWSEAAQECGISRSSVARIVRQRKRAAATRVVKAQTAMADELTALLTKYEDFYTQYGKLRRSLRGGGEVDESGSRRRGRGRRGEREQRPGEEQPADLHATIERQMAQELERLVTEGDPAVRAALRATILNRVVPTSAMRDVMQTAQELAMANVILNRGKASDAEIIGQAVKEVLAYLTGAGRENNQADPTHLLPGS